VNFAQICSAVPVIFHAQTKKTNKKVADNAKNRILRSSLRAVKTKEEKLKHQHETRLKRGFKSHYIIGEAPVNRQK